MSIDGTESIYRAISCRICGNANLVSIVNLGSQYQTGTFPQNALEPLMCGPLELVKCHPRAKEDCCGLVQLAHSYDPKQLYGMNYGYRSGLNRSMVNHLRGAADDLQQLVRLKKNDLIVDIGSNDGTMLSFYPQGNCNLVGIDPSGPKFQQHYRADIKLIPTFFSAQAIQANVGSQKARIVTSIAMFYDLARPLDFAIQVAEILAEDGVWMFEQSYLVAMLASNAYDTICHEHVEYYAMKQIKWIMDHAGLKIIRVTTNDTNGGSFAVTVAKSGSSYPEAIEQSRGLVAQETAAKLESLETYRTFGTNIARHKAELLALIADIKAGGKRILGYGASTKGNVILQYCGLSAADIPFIAEVNPDKFGRVTPGTHIPIISEAQAHAMKPDYFLVFPWHFRENLIQREAAFLQAGGKMIFPLPQIDVVQN